MTRKLLSLPLVIGFVLIAVMGCEELTERPDTAPAFSKQVSDQSYTTGSDVELVLPSATGGDGRLTYSLRPRVPGLIFDAGARTLAGTPTDEGTYEMTYRVTDADNDADSLRFTITIADTRPEVHVLSKSLLENDVLTVTDDSLSFSQPVSYRQGDFIAGEISAKTPYGLLRKVTSVSADSRSVMTADTTLEDAIERGTVRISGTLTPDDLTPASRAALAEAGLAARHDGGLTPAATGEVQFGYDLSATDGSSTLGGSIDFVLGYELIADYDRGLKDVRFTVTPRQVVTLRLSTAGAFRKTWQIGPTLRFSPIPVPVAPFPVVFTPAVELEAGVGGGLVASVSATHTESVTVGVECDDECGDTESWSSINESHQTAASGVSFDTEAAGTIGVFVAPKMTFNLYGRLGGPYVRAISSIDANAALTNAESRKRCLHRSLQAALRGEVGGEASVSVFGRTLFSARLDEFSFDVVDPVVLWEEQGPCEEETPADTGPSFGADRVEDQEFTVGTAIAALMLPAASGGDAPLTYSLNPSVPGLRFDPDDRSLAGAPTQTGVYEMVYEARDVNDNVATMDFTIRINASPDGLANLLSQEDLDFELDVELRDRHYIGVPIGRGFVCGSDGQYGEPHAVDLSPAIPGLQFRRSSFFNPVGRLYGRPTQAGVYDMTLRWSCSSVAASISFTITVHEGVFFPIRLMVPDTPIPRCTDEQLDRGHDRELKVIQSIALDSPRSWISDHSGYTRPYSDSTDRNFLELTQAWKIGTLELLRPACEKRPSLGALLRLNAFRPPGVSSAGDFGSYVGLVFVDHEFERVINQHIFSVHVRHRPGSEIDYSEEWISPTSAKKIGYYYYYSGCIDRLYGPGSPTEHPCDFRHP